MVEQATFNCAVVVIVTLLTKVSVTGAKVTKAQPYLIPKGKRDNSMAEKYGEGKTPETQEDVQLSRIWSGM